MGATVRQDTIPRVCSMTVAMLLLSLAGCSTIPSTSPRGTTVPNGYAAWTEDRLDPAPSESLPDTSVLGGPHFDLQLISSTAVPQLSASDLLRLQLVTSYVDPVVRDATGPMRAPDGQELLLVRPGHIGALGGQYPPDDRPVNARVATADTNTPLTKFSPHSGLLIVAVPKGGPATLIVTDAGRDQSIDLRTGKPGADAIAAYVRPAPAGLSKGSLDAFIQPGALPCGRIDVKAALRPHYDSGSGNAIFASPGHAYLELVVTINVIPLQHVLGGTLDNAGSFEVRADGAPVTVVPGTGNVLPLSTPTAVAQQIRFVLGYEVAESVHTVTIAVHPQGGSLTVDGSPATVAVQRSASLSLTIVRPT